jgi:hypothetical protein
MCIREGRIWASTPVVVTEELRGFPQSFHANPEVFTELRENRFLPNPIQLARTQQSKKITASLNKPPSQK